MRERLGHGEAALRRAEVGAEDRQRNVVGGAGVARQRGGRFVESLAVVGDQLACAPGAVVDRVAVPGIDDSRRELDGAPERREVVAERIGTAFGIETDSGRDRLEEMVA